MAKEGSTISGLMDTFATTVSVALQYGVPLHDLVHKFAHVRFEPSGFTSNPEIPIAKSIVDYIFRWLGSQIPAAGRPSDAWSGRPVGDREIFGAAAQPRSRRRRRSRKRRDFRERHVKRRRAGFDGEWSGGFVGHPWRGGLLTRDRSGSSRPRIALHAARQRVAQRLPRSTASPASGSGNGPAPGKSNGNGNGARVTLGNLGIGKAQVTFAAQADAPSCAECGSIMVRNGSCYKCLNCGSTSGCS